MEPTESIARRLALALDSIEQQWIGKTVGIAYDIDTETGRIRIDFEPLGAEEQTVTVFASVRDVRAGKGNEN